MDSTCDAAVLLFFSLGINSIIAVFKTDLFSSFDSLTGPETLSYENVVEPGDFTNRIAHLTVNGVIQDVGEPDIMGNGRI